MFWAKIRICFPMPHWVNAECISNSILFLQLGLLAKQLHSLDCPRCTFRHPITPRPAVCTPAIHCNCTGNSQFSAHFPSNQCSGNT